MTTPARTTRSTVYWSINDDNGMRRTRAAAAAGALAVVLLSAVCWSGSGTARAAADSRTEETGQRATPAACYAFAVQALRQRTIVRHLPPVCRGLGPEQVNLVIGRAIRTVVGPLPKASARQLAEADSRYLGSLIRPVPPPRPASLGAGPAATSSTAAARLAALAAWLAAAAAGMYLLAGRLTRTGRRRIRVMGVPAWVAGGHAGLAVAGLGIWVAFVVTASSVLGWIDAVLTWVIAGLGMSTLLADAPAPDAPTQPMRTAPPAAATAALVSPAAAGTNALVSPARAPVVTIALHGVLATATIALVLVAVIGIG